MGNSQSIEEFPKHYIQTKREQHPILGNISYILNKDSGKKYIQYQRTFMIQSQYNSYYQKIMHRKQLGSNHHSNYKKINKHIINVLDIKYSEYSQLCGKTFKIHIFIQQFQSDLKKQFNQRRFKSIGFSQKQIFQILYSLTNSLIILYDNNIKGYHLSLESIVVINGMYKIIDLDLTSKPLPIYDFIHQFKLRKGIYLSPEHIQLRQSNYAQFLNQNPKSDIFTLGILILQMMSLQDMSQAYDYNQRKIYFSMIKSRIQELENNYGQRLIRILQLMLIQDQTQRIGLLGLKQMLQNKKVLNSQEERYKQNGSSYTSCISKDKQIVSNKQFKQNENQLSQQTLNNRNKEIPYHRLYNNKLKTSRSKMESSYQKDQKLPTIQLKKIKSNDNNNEKVVMQNNSGDYQKNHQNLNIKYISQINNQIASNHKILRNQNNDYQVRKQQVVLNQYKANTHHSQFEKLSALSHSSDMPVSPITNTYIPNNKYLQTNSFKLNSNPQGQIINHQKEQNRSYLTGNHRTYDYSFKNHQNYEYSQQNHQNYEYSQQNNPMQSLKRITNANYQFNNFNKKQEDKNLIRKQQGLINEKFYELQKNALYDNNKKQAIQTPRNVNKKNIFSINTVKHQDKHKDNIDSTRSTPIKHLQLIQTNKKQYQEMNKKTFGRYDFSNGAVYQGQFNQNNQFQGNGVLYYPNGKICYSGGWFQNCFHSFGVLYNQQIITETPTAHKTTNYQDFNKNDSNNWIQYEGEFVQDKKNGFGSLLMNNGDKFSGCFVNDMIQGFGTFYIKSTGQSINGIWVNNVLQK